MLSMSVSVSVSLSVSLSVYVHVSVSRTGWHLHFWSVRWEKRDGSPSWFHVVLPWTEFPFNFTFPSAFFLGRDALVTLTCRDYSSVWSFVAAGGIFAIDVEGRSPIDMGLFFLPSLVADIWGTFRWPRMPNSNHNKQNLNAYQRQQQ